MVCKQRSGPPASQTGRPAPDSSTSRHQAASPPQGSGSPKRSAAEFWAAYRSHVDGEHGGPVGESGNYWDFGALSCPLSDFELPPEVVAAWEACRAAHETYVDLVAVFDACDTDHWTRWHALRLASPGVSHAALRQLLAAMDSVPTETLVALCAAVPIGVNA